MKRGAFVRADRIEGRDVKRMKSKQRPVTAAEKVFWDRLANEIGCIACRHDGRENKYVSIHHIDGRTKTACHVLVIPLCAQHHQQDDTDPMGRVAVHPNGGRFKELYGTQRGLLDECLAILAENSKKGDTP